MKYDKNLLFLILFIIVMVISSFGTDEHYNHYLKEEIEIKDSIISVLETRIDSIITIANDPIVLAENLTKRGYIWQLTKEAGRYFGTNIKIKPEVNPAITPSLYKALLELPDTLDNVLVTSAYRNSRYSNHRDSVAIDIRKNIESERLLKWLATCEGEEWRVNNNIGMYIEYKYSSRVWNSIKKIPLLRASLKYNPHATKYHIHLYIKEKKRIKI